MNLAIITYALEIGGIEAVIRQLADVWIDEGHTVTIIETLYEGAWSSHFRESGYNILQIFPSPFRSRIHHVHLIARSLYNFDVVILNDAALAQGALGLLKDRSVAIPILHSNLTSMLHNATANKKQWDALAAVSPALRELALAYGAPAKKVTCIPNGINVSSSWPKDGADFARDKLFKLIYLGSINHTQKGVFHLPEIFSRFVAMYPNARFDIVGSGKDVDELRERFSLLDVPAPIFHGPLKNEAALDLLRKADALIMPSYYEGLPIVLLEAMAQGVVPVVSHLSGITDFVITDGKDGFVVPVGHVDAFALRLTLLAQDRVKLCEMSSAAWKTALDRFSSELMGRAYLELATKLLEERIQCQVRRSGLIDRDLLGDYPQIPCGLVRPVRKLLRILGLYREKSSMPLLYDPASNYGQKTP